MTVEKLFNSIYLGDRYCEKVIIKDNIIMFQINLISRIKEGAREWEYYNDKDLMVSNWPTPIKENSFEDEEKAIEKLKKLIVEIRNIRSYPQ